MWQNLNLHSTSATLITRTTPAKRIIYPREETFRVKGQHHNKLKAVDPTRMTSSQMRTNKV
jgi:hypothetical protein